MTNKGEKATPADPQNAQASFDLAGTLRGEPATMLLYEATADLPVRRGSVETPLAPAEAARIPPPPPEALLPVTWLLLSTSVGTGWPARNGSSAR